MDFRSPTWGSIRCLFESPIMDSHKFSKIPTIPADAFILDMEDAVPVGEKVAARGKVAHVLQHHDIISGALKVPRVNNLETPWGHDDLVSLRSAGATTVMYPKINSVKELEDVVSILTAEGVSPEIVVCIETVAGIGQVERIVAHPSVVAVAFGPGDLHVDAGIPLRSADGSTNPSLIWAKVRTIFAARAHGVAVLGMAFPRSIKDLQETRTLIEEDIALGFTGYCSFYPPQVELINEMFSPSPEEVEAAAEVVSIYERAVRAGNPAVHLADGRAILVHQYKEALRQLSRSERRSRLSS